MLLVQGALSNGTIYRRQYDYLFNEVIRSEVLANTRSISYTPSSTTNGYLSLNPYLPRYLNATPGCLYGDAEHYDYNAKNAYDAETYPISRFVNEFGMHAMPSIYAYDRILTKLDEFRFNGTEGTRLCAGSIYNR